MKLFRKLAISCLTLLTVAGIATACSLDNFGTISVQPYSSSEEEITSSEQNITIFSKPVNAADGKVKVFSQEIKDHASGVGKLFTWSANIEGISTRIVYYSQDETQLSIDEVFSDINVVITGDLAS